MKKRVPLKLLRKQLNRHKLRRSVRKITGFPKVFQDVLHTCFRGQDGWMATDQRTMMFVPQDLYPQIKREYFPKYFIPDRFQEYHFLQFVDVFQLGLDVDESEAITGSGQFEYASSRYDAEALRSLCVDFVEQGEVEANLYIRPEAPEGPNHLIFYGKKYGIVFGISPIARLTIVA